MGLSHDLFSKYLGEKAWLSQATGSLLNIVGLVVLAYTHQDLTRKTFQVKQKQLFWLYVILILAAISLPWHYHWIDLPVTYYLLFTTVSVIWQNYLLSGESFFIVFVYIGTFSLYFTFWKQSFNGYLDLFYGFTFYLSQGKGSNPVLATFSSLNGLLCNSLEKYLNIKKYF